MRFINALTYDHSQKVGDAVRKIFWDRPDDDDYAPACLLSLASRGYGTFLVEQLNKIDVADAKGNPLYLKYVEAVSRSREEAVRKKLLEIAATTTNDEYFMAALPAVDKSNDGLVLRRARELLAALPSETDRGESILQMIGERFPEQAKSVYRTFLATGSTQRAWTMCNVLWYGNPMAKELLAPLLDDSAHPAGYLLFDTCLRSRCDGGQPGVWTNPLRFRVEHNRERPDDRKTQGILQEGSRVRAGSA